jgi:hypothetical protein
VSRGEEIILDKLSMMSALEGRTLEVRGAPISSTEVVFLVVVTEPGGGKRTVLELPFDFSTGLNAIGVRAVGSIQLSKESVR